MSLFTGKTPMITGGTGSFGNKHWGQTPVRKNEDS